MRSLARALFAEAWLCVSGTAVVSARTERENGSTGCLAGRDGGVSSMKASFLKGVAVGSVVSTVVLFATAAFAGGGVGAIFNLGKYNPVNATTELAGSTNGKQLDVVNTSTGADAAGIGITVHSNRPPLTVNSSTKVNNLNADLLDGLDSSKLQRRVTGQCANGTAVSTINADGTVGCTTSAVYPIYHNMSFGQNELFDTFGGSGLALISECSNSLSVGLGYRNSGTNASTVNESLNTNGPDGSIVDTIPMPAGYAITSGVGGSQLGGQVVWVTSTGAFPSYTRWIISISISESVSASGCIFNGNAEVATSRYILSIGN